MGAVAVLVLLQSLDDIRRMLAGDLGYPVNLRIGGPPARNTVASLAHLHLLAAQLGWRGRLGHRAGRERGGTGNEQRGSNHRVAQRSRNCSLSLASFHASASSGAGLRSMIGFQSFDNSAFSAVNGCCAVGTSSSAKIASTGHSATHSVQSMHSSGSMTRKFGP